MELCNLLLDAPMWSCLIEIRDVGLQDTMQLLLRDPGTLAKHSPESVHRWHWLVARDRVFLVS